MNHFPLISPDGKWPIVKSESEVVCFHCGNHPLVNHHESRYGNGHRMAICDKCKKYTGYDLASEPCQCGHSKREHHVVVADCSNCDCREYGPVPEGVSSEELGKRFIAYFKPAPPEAKER